MCNRIGHKKTHLSFLLFVTAGSLKIQTVLFKMSLLFLKTITQFVINGHSGEGTRKTIEYNINNKT